MKFPSNGTTFAYALLAERYRRRRRSKQGEADEEGIENS